jgi:hypothetical protein
MKGSYTYVCRKREREREREREKETEREKERERKRRKIEGHTGVRCCRKPARLSKFPGSKIQGKCSV